MPSPLINEKALADIGTRFNSERTVVGPGVYDLPEIVEFATGELAHDRASYHVEVSALRSTASTLSMLGTTNGNISSWNEYGLEDLKSDIQNAPALKEIASKLRNTPDGKVAIAYLGSEAYGVQYITERIHSGHSFTAEMADYVDKLHDGIVKAGKAIDPRALDTLIETAKKHPRQQGQLDNEPHPLTPLHDVVKSAGVAAVPVEHVASSDDLRLPTVRQAGAKETPSLVRKG